MAVISLAAYGEVLEFTKQLYRLVLYVAPDCIASVHIKPMLAWSLYLPICMLHI